MKWIAAALTPLLVAVAACREPNVAGACDKAPQCLSGLECSYDSARGCQVCHCKAPFGQQASPAGPTAPPVAP